MAKRKKVTLSHLDKNARARMVDVSRKSVTSRTAIAAAVVTMHPEVLDAMLAGDNPKGDALGVARIAGIQAAKRTDELIPLCHPLGLDFVGVDFERTSPGELAITATAKTSSKTGVEMEALTAASVAALAIYDMGKAADKAMTIGPIQLESKTGGKSGTYRRKQQ